MTNLIDEVSVKACTKCGEVKALSEFYRNAKGKDGLRSECKVCTNLCVQNYLKNNREKVNAKSQNWAKNNREKVKAYRKASSQKATRSLTQWYISHKLKLKVSQLNPELVALKSEQLTMKRMALELKREMKKAIESTNQKEVVK